MAELTRRYIVMTMSAEGPFDLEDAEAPFVLKPWKDPAALRALETYRAHCYPELAEELDRWIAMIREGPVVRGGVGARNEQYLAAHRGPASAERRPRARPRRKTARASTKITRNKPMKRKKKRIR